ncbi:MAG: UDP-N-acetylmuramate dehydrogenase [Flavobacteriaceae bacterium]
MYSLKAYNTFGIDVNAKEFISVSSLPELQSVLEKYKHEEIFVLGGGSNMLLTQDIQKPVVHINLTGIQIVKQDKSHVWVEVQAGENWHQFVLWTLENDFGGIENLSLIPGNIGSAPIQNIGAYGVELKDVFDSCKAINIKTQEIKTFTLAECKFGYRESVFKSSEKDKYIILSVTLKLTKKDHKISTSYGVISNELQKMEIYNPTIQDISKAVIAIRQSKLPDPKEIGNSGSFFKNPVVTRKTFEKVQEQYPEMPFYEVSENEIKIPAGWLIETAGFKGKRFGDAGVHQKQALVLVNYGNATGKEIYDLAKTIQKTILDKFGIVIETEVNIVP